MSREGRLRPPLIHPREEEMRVEILTSISGQYMALEPGQSVEMNDAEARRLIAKGYAKAETATRKAPEKATRGKK